MKRYASTIALHSELKEKYLKMHRAVWPGVHAMISACRIKNFSIFMRTMPDMKDYLFMYFEYHGSNYTTDMQRMADDKTTQEWWSIINPCQDLLPNRIEGEWWAPMEEVCHLD